LSRLAWAENGYRYVRRILNLSPFSLVYFGGVFVSLMKLKALRIRAAEVPWTGGWTERPSRWFLATPAVVMMATEAIAVVNFSGCQRSSLLPGSKIAR